MLSGMILKEAREVMLYKREESIVCVMTLARPKERGVEFTNGSTDFSRSTEVYPWEQRQRM